jgi:hypothetical protein
MERVVQIFGSLQAADEADAREDVRMLPAERIQIVIELRNGFYPAAHSPSPGTDIHDLPRTQTFEVLRQSGFGALGVKAGDLTAVGQGKRSGRRGRIARA